MLRIAVLSLLALAECPLQAAPSPADGDQSPSASPASYPPAPQSPECNDFRISNDSPLSNTQRTCIYGSNLITTSAVLGAAFTAGWAQLFKNDPQEWGRGPLGYSRSFGTRYAQGMAKATGSYLTGMVTREDPRHVRSTSRNIFHRIWFAGSTLIIDRRRGNRPAFGPVAGALSSGFTGMAWEPAPDNTASKALRRSGTALAGSLAYAELYEFEPDIFKLVGKWFSPKLK